MARRWIVLVLAVVILRAAHGQWLAGTRIAVGMTFTECVGIGLAVVAVGSAVAVTARTGWLAARTHRTVMALGASPLPSDLNAALDRTGTTRPVMRLDAADRAAFCAGVLRPRIFVTTGMVHSMRAEELDAVLLHEDAHAARRDPLRRALMQATADVLFYMPLVGWWSGQQRERAELAADRAAVARIGRAPVAAALWAAAAAQPSPAVGFDGAAQARVAQLLGDDPPHRSPSAVTWLTSLAGLALVVVLAMCAGQTMEYLLLS